MTMTPLVQQWMAMADLADAMEPKERVETYNRLFDAMSWEERFWVAWLSLIKSEGERKNLLSKRQPVASPVKSEWVGLSTHHDADTNAKRAARNAVVQKEYAAGATFSVLSHRHQLSTDTIREILRLRKRKHA